MYLSTLLKRSHDDSFLVCYMQLFYSGINSNTLITRPTPVTCRVIKVA